jgi:hypothetical protein
MCMGLLDNKSCQTAFTMIDFQGLERQKVEKERVKVRVVEKLKLYKP